MPSLPSKAQVLENVNLSLDGLQAACKHCSATFNWTLNSMGPAGIVKCKKHLKEQHHIVPETDSPDRVTTAMQSVMAAFESGDLNKAKFEDIKIVVRQCGGNDLKSFNKKEMIKEVENLLKKSPKLRQRATRAKSGKATRSRPNDAGKKAKNK